MKNTKTALILFAVTLAMIPWLATCDHDHDSDAHHAAAAMPQLNNGKRWLTDEPTRSGFARLRADISRPIPTGQTIESYNARAQKVTEEINSIFAACKMTGDGHVELHKYIALLLEDIEPMRGKELKAAEQAQEKFSRDLDMFQVYFE